MSVEAPGRLDDPYVGPVSFRLGDHLYGRDRECEELLDLLIAERIVLLYSPSGAGKTSLIEASLVPALREAGFEVLPSIRVTHTLPPEPAVPSPRNRYALSVLLSLEQGVPQEHQLPVADLAVMSLQEYLRERTDRDGRPGNEVLIFDQFEEILTTDPTDEPAKHAFFQELGEVLRDRGHWALFSMREDFLASLDPYLKHVPTRFKTTSRLDLLSVSEALEAIRRPAARLGVDFTEDAAEHLVDDLRTVRVQRPDGIVEVLGSYVEPVQLQVACHVLWSTLAAGSTAITVADVEALGRVDRALGDYYAERVRAIAQRSGVSERVIRDWFEERLITPQGLRSQVLEGPESPANTGHRVVDELLDAHLVRGETRRQATWYELAHDRLIEPIRRDNAAWQDEHLSPLERAAMLWEQSGRPDRLLLIGEELAAAERREGARAEEEPTRRRADFLDASRRADEQARRERRSTRRLRLTTGLSTALAILAVTLLAISGWAWNSAEQQKRLTGMLLGAAWNLDNRQDVGVALAAKGRGVIESATLPDAGRDVLERAATSPVSLVLGGQSGTTESAALTRNGSFVVGAGEDDIRIWDRVTGQTLAELPLEDGEAVDVVDVSDDGGTVIAGSADGTVLVWHPRSQETTRWSEDTSPDSAYVWDIALSPSGDRILTIDEGKQVKVWGLDGGLASTVEDPGSSSTYSAAFSPDGNAIATVGDNPEVVFWESLSGREVGRLGLPEAAYSVAFGPDGRTLATVTSSEVTVWNLARWEPEYQPLDVSAAGASSWTFDTGLTRAVSVDAIGSVRIWDLASGQEVASSSMRGASTSEAILDEADPGRVLVLGKQMDAAFWDLRPAGALSHAVAVARAGDEIFQAWSDGSMWRWPGEPDSDDERVEGIRTDGDVWELSASRDGSRLAALTTSGQVRVWDTAAGTVLFALEPDGDQYWDVDLTPDGTLLVVGDVFGVVHAWDVDTGMDVGEIASDDLGRAATQLVTSPDGTSVLIALESPPGAQEASALWVPIFGEGQPVELSIPSERDMTATAVAYGSDGLVVVGTSDGQVVGFRPTSDDSVTEWSIPDVHQGEIENVFVTDDGTVLTTGWDEAVAYFDPSNDADIEHLASASVPLAAVMDPDRERIGVMTQDSGMTSVPTGTRELLDLLESKVVYHFTPEECETHGLGSDC